MLSRLYDPMERNSKPFIYLIPEGSGVYKCQGRGVAAFGITMRAAYERWVVKVGVL